jgi:hypothetical protein
MAMEMFERERPLLRVNEPKKMGVRSADEAY